MKKVVGKIEHWLKTLKQLQAVELPTAKKRVGEAAEGGDWQENAEYEDAERQVEVIEARIRDIKNLINKLRKEKKS